ncbi:hypothetical protein [Ornithinimicrobium panacihumi]|uniref:hypothetical protein n=1 Tax=Ornithinimicrobium panacihumi TaxID=2008449 RepID=UPI003F8A75F3
MTAISHALAQLQALPGVEEGVATAREACTGLRWHEGLRRRTPEAAAESRVRGAAASAMLEGAEPAGSEGSVDLVRDLMRGAMPWSARQEDPVWRVLAGAVRVTAATEGIGPVQLKAPAQVLAALHSFAARELIPAEQLGRPRTGGEDCREWVELGEAPSPAGATARLQQVQDLIRVAAAGSAPTLIVAAVAHAELVVARPFVAGNALVARAVERVILRSGGLDPTGVAVPEVGHADRAGTDYRGALGAYASGGQEGVRLWLLHCAEAVQRAAAEGVRVADAVRAGRLR